MKTLKFAPHLVEKILSGEKTSTWRLFDDKDLQKGDELIFINKESGKQFGTALITSLTTKTLGTLTDEDKAGHEKYSSDDEMYASFRNYYGDKVDENSEVKILTFELKKKQSIKVLILNFLKNKGPIPAIAFLLALTITSVLYWPPYQKIPLDNQKGDLANEISRLDLPLGEEIKEILSSWVNLPLNRHQLCLEKSTTPPQADGV